MALEIERRFLVRGENWRRNTIDSQELQQGYLASNAKDWTVRIRILANKKAWLTLKNSTNGFSNNEFEYLIPLTEAKTIWKLISNKVTKTRYFLDLPGGEWVIDCFHGANSPLVIAEVELASEVTPIELPTWCAKEVTGEYQWSNAALAQTPYSSRSIKKSIYWGPLAGKGLSPLDSLYIPVGLVSPAYAVATAGRLALYGLYDKDGILRYVCGEREACIAYAELFDLQSIDCSLMSLPEPSRVSVRNFPRKNRNRSRSQAMNNN